MAGAAPVVSRIDGIPEDVTDGESGLMAAPGDAEDLARVHAIYRARFSADAFARALRDAYTRLGFPPADSAHAFVPAAAAAG